MEQLHTTRRSASHGALNKSYTAHGSPNPRVASSPFSRPLRSVNENTILLPSPGPLESMLKTTTETGDIGLFSIKPISSSTINDGTLRARPGLGQRAFARSLNTENADTVSLHDDRRRLPSYRDTTSEIISMYGSESQRSASSTLSRAFDDVGPRSYSMTSCSSRPLPNQKSSGTLQSLQSHSSAGPLQRPRSPFPYPTRLKRLGIRPSSPALTENGSVDYSRMVEIDRVPSRTIHGSFKPSYGRLPPPWFPRSETSQSTAPFGPGAGANGYQACRPSSSSSQYLRANGSRNRVESKGSEHSQRSASLSSIVDMYQNTTGMGGLQTGWRSKPANAFYYDYSEGFDTGTDRIPAPGSPVAPVPTRAPSMHRPKVLDDDCHSQIGVGRESCDNTLTTLPEISSCSAVCVDRVELKLTTTQEIHSRAKPHENMVDVLSDVSNRYQCSPDQGNCVAPAMRQGPSTQQSRAREDVLRGCAREPPAQQTLTDSRCPVQVSLSNRQLESAAVTSRGQHRPGSEQGCRNPMEGLAVGTQGSNITTERQETRPLSRSGADFSGEPNPAASTDVRRQSISPALSRHQPRSKFYSIEPGLSDLASLVRHLDRAGQFSLMTNEDVTSLKTSMPGSKGEAQLEPKSRHALTSPDRFRLGFDGASGAGPSHEDFSEPAEDVERPLESSTTRAALESAISRSSSQDLEFIDRSKTPMLAPKPISPARELRVKNSIPQLMKALPPLPDGDIPSNDMAAPEIESLPNESDSQVRPLPMSFSKVSTSGSSSRSPSLTPVQKPVCMELDSKDRTREVLLEQGTASKSKMRLKNSTSLDSMSPHRLVRSDPDIGISGHHGNDLILEPIDERVGDFAGNKRLKFKAFHSPQSKPLAGHGAQNGQGGLRRSGSLSTITARRAMKVLSPRKVRKSVIKPTDINPDVMRHEDGDGFSDAKEQDVSAQQFASPGAQISTSRAHADDGLVKSNTGTVIRSKAYGRFTTPLERESRALEDDNATPKVVRALRKPLSNVLIRPGESHELESLVDSRLSRGNASSSNPVAIGIATAVTSTPSLQDTSANPDLSKNAETLDDHDGPMLESHRGLKNRLSRWLKSAKYAIKACNRRRSSSPSS